MEKFQKQVVAFLRGLTPTQVALLVGSCVLVGATIWVFVRLLGGAEYKPLYTGLAQGDAQSLTQELAAQNIDFQVSADGTTVLVPSNQIDKARLDVASRGPLSSGRMGFELFDKPNWSGSDFSEKVNYQRALETELERTIQTMNGVEAVRVHLVLPHESLFTERERPAKAAVVLKLRGTRMSDQVGRSVANLVSSAWDDLSPQNVTVITTDGQMPGQIHSESEDGGGGMADLETAMAERIVQVLAPMVGSDHVRSSVTVEYDPTSGESTQDVYDPAASAVLTSQISQETADGLEPSGIPGTASNAPNTPPAGAAANQSNVDQSGQAIRTESKTFAVSHTVRHLIEPAGRIKRLAAAVLVDDVAEAKTENGKAAEARRKRTPEEMKQIEDLTKAAIGWDGGRGDQISVQNVSFRIPDVEKPEAPSLPERVRVVAERWTGLLRYVGVFALFLLVYFLILNPVKSRVLSAIEAAGTRASNQQALPANGMAGSPGLAGGEHAMLGSGAGAAQQLQQANLLKQQIVTRVKTDAENAARPVQDWLRSGA
ncbi:MAG TPA: flagellar basal-body MS-ring/collar protein FliF [Candidatus Acidoferrum sp.]|nr:flagellar basal-body MS-ring/collar protein FliF [Candidatus Acidoferrum sp.]